MSTSPLIVLSNPPDSYTPLNTRIPILARSRTTPLSPLNPNRFGTSPVQIDHKMDDEDSQDSHTGKGYYRSSSPSEPLTSPTPAHFTNTNLLSPSPRHSLPPIRHQVPPSRLPSSSTTIIGHSLASSSSSRLHQHSPPSSTQRLQSNRPQPRWSSSAAYQRTHDALMGSRSGSESGNEGNTVKSAMWRDKFRQRCLKRQERRSMGSDGKASDGPMKGVSSDGELYNDDEEAEREDEEIFRRIMAMQRRRAIHASQASYDQEVGSDPAVWESEVREAEGDEDIPPDMTLAMEDEELWAMMEQEAVEQEHTQRVVERGTMDGLLDGIDAKMLWDELGDEDVEMGG